MGDVRSPLQFYINTSSVADAIGVSTFTSTDDIARECIYSYKTKSAPRDHSLSNFKITDSATRQAVVNAVLTPELHPASCSSSPDELLHELSVVDMKEKQIDNERNQVKHQMHTIETNRDFQSSDYVHQMTTCLQQLNELNKQYDVQQTKGAKVLKEALSGALSEATDVQSTHACATINKCEERVVETVLQTIESSQQRQIVDGIKEYVNTSRGCALENDVANKYEERNKCSVKERNANMYYEVIRFDDDHSIRIGGRIDGVDADNSKLVEIKCRRYKFLGIRDYEKVQLELYLRMTDLKTAVLVERFEGEQREHEYVRNDQFFELIRRGLSSFHEKCRQCLMMTGTE